MPRSNSVPSMRPSWSKSGFVGVGAHLYLLHAQQAIAVAIRVVPHVHCVRIHRAWIVGAQGRCRCRDSTGRCQRKIPTAPSDSGLWCFGQCLPIDKIIISTKESVLMADTSSKRRNPWPLEYNASALSKGFGTSEPKTSRSTSERFIVTKTKAPPPAVRPV